MGRPLLPLLLALAVAVRGAAAQQLPGPPPLRGILFVGQSNLVGGNLGPRLSGPGGPDALPENVWVLDRSDRVAPWHQPLPFPLPGKESGTSQNVSMAIAFARRLAADFPQERFCLVFGAQDGAGFNCLQGDPDTNLAAPPSPCKLPGNLYDRLVQRAAAAQAQGVEFVLGVCAAGESDTSVLSQSALEDEFRWLVESLRQDVGPMPFAFAAPPQWSIPAFPQLPNLTAALGQVVLQVPQTALATAEGLQPEPNYIAHFDAASSRLLGGRLADALVSQGLWPMFAGAAVAPPSATLGLLPPAGVPRLGVVLHQDFVGSPWFPSYSAALDGQLGAGTQLSRLQRFEAFRRATGEFRLRVEWSTGEWLVFEQTSNPMHAPRDTVEGLRVVDDPLGLVAAGLVGGLCRTSASGAVLSLRPGATSLQAPLAGLYLYNEFEVAAALGIATVLRSPLGLPATAVTIEAQ
jgi:hypothetical protein